MKDTHPIIASGGWRIEHRRVRVKALCFTGLCAIWSGFWIFGALVGLFDQSARSFLQWIIADWAGRAYGFCLVLHPIILILTLAFWLTERPREIAIRRELPDYDPHKLY
jgi:hypothetical protein